MAASVKSGHSTMAVRDTLRRLDMKMSDMALAVRSCGPLLEEMKRGNV